MEAAAETIVASRAGDAADADVVEAVELAILVEAHVALVAVAAHVAPDEVGVAHVAQAVVAVADAIKVKI